MGVAKSVGKMAGPIVWKSAPSMTAGWVRQAFDMAVDGVGPLRGAVEASERQLRRQGGDVDEAIDALIDSHVRMAGAQGLVTNLGGVLTAAIAIPTNISGLAMLQCHLIAGIAHLRGYDINDPRVRNAVIACMLGKDTVKKLVKKKKLPGTPMALATAPFHDPSLDYRIAADVTAELLAQVAGKRTVVALGRRTPFIGGAFAMVLDGFATHQAGQYAARELRSRLRPSLPQAAPAG